MCDLCESEAPIAVAESFFLAVKTSEHASQSGNLVTTVKKWNAVEQATVSVCRECLARYMRRQRYWLWAGIVAGAGAFAVHLMLSGKPGGWLPVVMLAFICVCFIFVGILGGFFKSVPSEELAMQAAHNVLETPDDSADSEYGIFPVGLGRK